MKLAHYVNRLLSKVIEQLYVSVQNQQTIPLPPFLGDICY